jgi:hypothetical protein
MIPSLFEVLEPIHVAILILVVILLLAAVFAIIHITDKEGPKNNFGSPLEDPIKTIYNSRNKGSTMSTGSISSTLAGAGEVKVGDDVMFVELNYAQPDGNKESPAKVTKVWNSNLVNLTVFFDARQPEPRTSVPREGSTTGMSFYFRPMENSGVKPMTAAFRTAAGLPPDAPSNTTG